MRLRRGNYLIAAAVTIFHIVTAVLHGGPVAVPDVSAYLSVSQWLHGGLLPTELNFHPGYGFLLAPFGWLSGHALHTCALLLNALLAGVFVLLAARFVRIFDAPRWLLRIAAVIAAIHPSLSTSSRIAWPETLLAVMVLGLALLIHADRWGWVGMCGGIATAVHPRAVVVTCAAVLLAVAERRSRTFLMGLIPGLIAVALALQATNSWPSARINAAKTLGDGPDPLATLSGQWLAFGAGTAGLAALGLLLALRGVVTRSCPASWTFLGISAVGMLILGAWVLAGSERADTLLYGRYMGPWAVPLTLVALVCISTVDIPRWCTRGVITCTLLAVTLSLLGTGDVNGGPRRIMTLSVGGLWAVMDNRLSATMLICALVVILSVRAAQRGSMIPLAAFFLIAVSSTFVNHFHLHEVGAIADGQVTAASLLPVDAECLSHDATAKSYALWLYRLELPDIRHERINLQGGTNPCGRYVIATPDATARCKDATLLADEPRAQWALWRYPKNGCG
jgi:hypothetical protein